MRTDEGLAGTGASHGSLFAKDFWHRLACLGLLYWARVVYSGQLVFRAHPPLRTYGDAVFGLVDP